MQSSDGEVSWSAGQSLWSIIREHVSESELPKIHTALGHSLVDRYTEAYAEMEMWQGKLSDSRTWTPLPGPGRHRAPLADPPAVKELVRAEVCMLLQTLRERAGRNGEEHLSLYKPETVSYALGHTDRCYSQLSEASDPRSVSRLSTQSNAEAEIEEVRENLNVDGIEQVLHRLKSLFIEECEALKKEIKQLQRNIWMKSQQKDLEPTLGDLKELRDAVQRDLTHYPAPYTSSLKELKSTHRLASCTAHLTQAFTAPSLSSACSNHTPFTHPKPPTGPPPCRTTNSAKTTGFSSPLKTPITAITEPRKTTPPKCNLTSTSRTSRSQMSHRDSNSSPENYSVQRTTPTDTSSSAIKPQKNSAIHKTHSAPHNERTESNLSPQMERSLGRRSRKNNMTSSTIFPHSYESNEDDKSSDCSGERSETPNEPQNITPGCNLLTLTHDSTRKSVDTASNKCEMGIAKGLDKEITATGSGHRKEAVAVLYTKSKGHLSSSSPKTVLKVSASQTHKEKQERAEYLNRFIQPVPPPRLK